MERTKLKRILNRILKIILVLIIFILIASTNGKNRTSSWAEDFAKDFIIIPQRVVQLISSAFNDNNTIINDIEKLEEKNKVLNSRVAELEEKLADYDIVVQQNEKFKALEKATDLYKDYDVIMADVIAVSPNNWDEVYVIDKGKENGITPNMPVITTDGLVGYVSEVGEKSSKIISILDASSSFSAIASETREQVIVKGDLILKEENKVKISEIPFKTIYKSGDTFETSGIGGIYPKGLKIGKTIEFINKENPLENEAILETYVNFNKLERVAIIKMP